jgi:hypothetical protein
MTMRINQGDEQMSTYILKDQLTSFFDPETGLKIVRDQQVAAERIGRATAAAIQSGRLIEVQVEPEHPGATAKKTAPQKRGE